VEADFGPIQTALASFASRPTMTRKTAGDMILKMTIKTNQKNQNHETD
jgi:hypothetical protein